MENAKKLLKQIEEIRSGLRTLLRKRQEEASKKEKTLAFLSEQAAGDIKEDLDLLQRLHKVVTELLALGLESKQPERLVTEDLDVVERFEEFRDNQEKTPNGINEIVLAILAVGDVLNRRLGRLEGHLEELADPDNDEMV